MKRIIDLAAARQAREAARFLHFRIVVWPSCERGLPDELWVFSDGLLAPQLDRCGGDLDRAATDLANIIEGEIGGTGSTVPRVLHSEELGVTYGFVGVDLDGRGVARFACLAEEAARYPYATARARFFVQAACRAVVCHVNPRKRWQS